MVHKSTRTALVTMTNADRKPIVLSAGYAALVHQRAIVQQLTNELSEQKAILRSLQEMHDFITLEVPDANANRSNAT